MKQLGVVIHPSLKTFTVGNIATNYNYESRRISYLIVDSAELEQIIIKQVRNKKNLGDVFLLYLRFDEDLATTRSDFEDRFDKQRKELIMEFMDVTGDS